MSGIIKEALEKNQKELLGRIFVAIEGSEMLDDLKTLKVMTIFCGGVVDDSHLRLIYFPAVIDRIDHVLFGKDFSSDKMFVIVLCFRNMMEIIQSEVFLSLKNILKISIRILNDSDDNINSKSDEIESIIKNKILNFFDDYKQNHQVVHRILEALDSQNKKSLMVKEWCLAWFKFVLNLDINSTLAFYPKLVISILNFFSEISSEDLLAKLEDVLDHSLKVYCQNRDLTRLEAHLVFVHQLLKNANSEIKPMIFNTRSQVYVKALDKSLDYILAILGFLQNSVHDMVSANRSKESESQSQFSEIPKTKQLELVIKKKQEIIEEILNLCIEFIFKFQNSDLPSIKLRVTHLKPIVLDLDFFKNLLLFAVIPQEKTENQLFSSTVSVSQILEKGNFYSTIHYVSEEIVHVEENNIEWAVSFLEKFFEIEPEIFSNYLDKFRPIVNSSNQVTDT